MAAVNERGEQLRQGLRALQAEDDGIADVRGLGLMNGIEFYDPARVGAITKYCLDEHHLLLMNAGTFGSTVRLMPPLVVTEAEVDLALDALAAGVKATR
jgi:4-aminobutyrate aminotransferase